jgi:hypothetical protein
MGYYLLSFSPSRSTIEDIPILNRDLDYYHLPLCIFLPYGRGLASSRKNNDENNLLSLSVYTLYSIYSINI